MSKEGGFKAAAIRGFSWSFLEKFASQALQFIIGIILARLLTPVEYGITGMIAVFLSILSVFWMGGMGEALVRKTKPTHKDYSTVFIFNFVVAIASYLVLVLFAPQISVLFNEPVLTKIIYILGLTLIINSMGFVPRSYLWKQMDFKRLTIVSLLSTLTAGTVGIILAYHGYGVWSLVYKSIVASSISTVLMLFLSSVKIKITFSVNSFREFFGFSSKLLLSGIISQLFQNVYSLVIAKYFDARELGLYSRASNYKNLPSKTLDSVIQSVSFPLLSSIKDDQVKLKSAYKRLIKSTMLLSFVLLLMMAASSENLIIGLIGQKWSDAIPYLQLLCFVGIFYPLHSLNLNMLVVMGRSDLFLKVGIIKKVFVAPNIFIVIYFGVLYMIVAMIFFSIVAYLLNSYWSGRLINYGVREQLQDILPSFIVSIVTGAVVFVIGLISPFNNLLTLTIQLSAGLLTALFLVELVRLESYLFLKQILIERVRSFKFGK